MANIYFSDTNVPPYNRLEEQFFTITIDHTSGLDIVEEERKLYLVVEAGAGYFPWIMVAVRGETASGVSLWVSKVDPLDNPIKWEKDIQFDDVDARYTTQTFPFKIKFTVLNNIYLLTPQNRKGGMFLHIFTP